MDLAGMVMMEEASRDSMKIPANCPKGMTESGPRVKDAITDYDAVRHVDNAFLAAKEDDGYDEDRL